MLDLDLSLDLSFHTQGRDEFSFLTRITGTGEIAPGQGCERFGPGDLFLGVTPETDRVHRTHHSHSRSVNIASTVFEELIRDGPGEPSGHWGFTSSTPIAGGKARWNRTVRLLEEIADPQASSAASTLGPITRMLAVTALAVFPSAAVAGPQTTDRHDSHPDTLRRAVTFIDAHPDLDITLRDVARSANVTPRAVQLAFRRHADTTPMAYLRQVRPHHAHLELLATPPDDGLTVTRIAVDWGSASPSRFAAQCRAAYGETPSETLES